MFPSLFAWLPERSATAVVASFVRRCGSTSPSLGDMRDGFARFVARARIGGGTAVARELVALDVLAGELIDGLVDAPAFTVTPDWWLNPNVRVLASRLPLAQVWEARGRDRRLRIRSVRGTKRPFAVVLTRSGIAVRALDPREHALLEKARAGALAAGDLRASDIEALAAKALLLAA